MEEKLVSILRENGMFLTTVESCTGGMLASKIVGVSGASDVFREGFITYANSAKETYAGVSRTTLEKYGAVSSQVAMEMAQGAAKKTGSNVVISVTGIAGPGGGTKEKPVGLVYIGCYVQGTTYFKECHFNGDRLKIREDSVETALFFTIEMIERYCREKQIANEREV